MEPLFTVDFSLKDSTWTGLFNLLQQPTIYLLELMSWEKSKRIFLPPYFIYLEWSKLVLSA